MKATTFYEVHSDCDENNIRECFEGKGAKQAAVAYAKRNKEEMTWVDRVTEYEDGDYEYECIWSYDVEE